MLLLHKVVQRNIDANGRLFIFNKDYISQYYSENIHGVLKVKSILSISEIKKILDELYLISNSPRKVVINNESIKKCLDFLYGLGVVDMIKDKGVDKYCLTAKGGMLKL